MLYQNEEHDFSNVQHFNIFSLQISCDDGVTILAGVSRNVEFAGTAPQSIGFCKHIVLSCNKGKWYNETSLRNTNHQTLQTLTHFAWDSMHLPYKNWAIEWEMLPNSNQLQIFYHWAKISPRQISCNCPILRLASLPTSGLSHGTNSPSTE